MQWRSQDIPDARAQHGHILLQNQPEECNIVSWGACFLLVFLCPDRFLTPTSELKIAYKTLPCHMDQLLAMNVGLVPGSFRPENE